MYIKIRNKKIELFECDNILKRFKSFKLYLFPIENGLFFPNRKILNTYFFCQRVDALFVDEDFNIVQIYHNLKSEKIHLCFRAKHLIILPANSSIDLDIDYKINIIK